MCYTTQYENGIKYHYLAIWVRQTKISCHQILPFFDCISATTKQQKTKEHRNKVHALGYISSQLVGIGWGGLGWINRLQVHLWLFVTPNIGAARP